MLAYLAILARLPASGAPGAMQVRDVPCDLLAGHAVRKVSTASECSTAPAASLRSVSADSSSIEVSDASSSDVCEDASGNHDKMTAMVRNIPNGYTRDSLVELFNKH